jgi:hypothetical protein
LAATTLTAAATLSTEVRVFRSSHCATLQSC